MISCFLKGGLGNMLFQIASTISISKKYRQTYSFPNLFEHFDFLNYETTHNQKLNYSNEYIDFLYKLPTEQPPNFSRLVQFPIHYIEPILPFDEDIVLDGYFQSEKYFENYRNEILDIFDFKYIKNKAPLSEFDFGNKRYTSIHVRKGDYIRFETFYHFLTNEYYDVAIEMLKDKTDEFLVFSDDIDACKEMFNGLDNVRFIENEKDYVELYLMTLCDNNIIANSTFSWWGAWLNKNENKIVIGPSKWFGPSISEYSGDIIPEKWIKI